MDSYLSQMWLEWEHRVCCECEITEAGEMRPKSPEVPWPV